MTLSELIEQWTGYLFQAANLVLIFAGFIGVLLVVVSMQRAYADTRDGRSPVRHYIAAGIAGAITVLGVIVGLISNLVVG
ncbi:hypothetical protein SAMN04488527_13014 [Aliiroseovarius crassostreae]|uniref:Uncharacterized protein n=1 Tax=Aliiroseovarius crassostreae TaxID=154981 RepID=A0A0P7J513_9RHOB|nr:hypothetical protein [Aliiroseovarius crassostreae]KPN62954.1 hypothetical protein AKJ29_02060 [Aliiroseovarius crassostreae]SFU89489.1 hypothetical protein SAMN04488527_13014 [Aliiroseovarius crassostreae]